MPSTQDYYWKLFFKLEIPCWKQYSQKIPGYVIESSINPFVPNAIFLYPLKTSENRKVFWCFQMVENFHGVEKGCIENKWVRNSTVFILFKAHKKRHWSDFSGFVLLSLLLTLNMSCTSKVFAVDFNPFHASVSFLYPLKTWENQRFSDIQRL